MQIINGNEIAQEILSKLASQVKRLPFKPLFCDVLIGNDPVASSYVKIKARRAEEIGLKFELIQLHTTVDTAEVIKQLKQIQLDPFLSGLIVQLPLPSNLDKAAIIAAIDQRVDVDCLNNSNSRFQPPTAAAVMKILDETKVDLATSKILVIGQGELVGKPVTALLQNQNLTPITADQSTNNLNQLTLEADVIIAATGSGKLITGDMIKQNAVLIDCGTSESSGNIVGDIDTESVKDKAKFIAPVPGGVGPVTVAMLLQNVVEVARDLE